MYLEEFSIFCCLQHMFIIAHCFQNENISCYEYFLSLLRSTSYIYIFFFCQSSWRSTSAKKTAAQHVRQPHTKTQTFSQSMLSDLQFLHVPVPLYLCHEQSLHHLLLNRNHKLHRTVYRSHPDGDSVFRYFLCHQIKSCICVKAVQIPFLRLHLNSWIIEAHRS